MTLAELLQQGAITPQNSVPEWLLGAYRRASISFANGLCDSTTRVWWLQSRNFTIDLRLPQAADLPSAKPWAEYSASELQVLANCEGWSARSFWQDEMLSWAQACSLQTHNRWSEPAQLRRVGNCMVEFAPSGAYVEDWRLQACGDGPLLGLELVSDCDEQSGEVIHRGGGLIICGTWAALVLGRPAPVPTGVNAFRAAVNRALGQEAELARLFQFETSLAYGDCSNGFAIVQSTKPERMGQSLLWGGEFSLDRSRGLVTQQFVANGRPRVRTFAVDTLEPQAQFALSTPSSKMAEAWYADEAETLARYASAFY